MVGRLLDGRYQVRARIARGGMATVYLATDLRLERRVAIKVMHGHLADDASFRERFIQEARSAARLAHPNVVNVFDQGQDMDMAYLVMEYLQGITLRDLLKEYGKLTPEQTMDIMEAVLAGLVAAHRAGIVHRDLKPENVLLADDGRIKIGDFGLARAVTANTATGQALLGTIAYLSPELITRGIADTRSDIYAVGIMMYEMLVGEQPFRGDQPVQIAYQHANDSVPTPSDRNPTVPVALDELVLWATARDPEQRPRDARAMLDQLFETQNLIRDGRGGIASSAPQRTAVLPALAPAGAPVGAPAPTGDTQLVPRNRRSGPIALESAAQLSSAAQRRRRRGFWLFGFVLLLAALAGGTGWYFGSGPGAMVSVPAVAGRSLSAATGAITTSGLSLGGTREVFDFRTAVGLVSATEPAPGAELVKGSPVTLLLSKGAESLPVPPVGGLTEQAAGTVLSTARFTLGASGSEFSSTVPPGSVLRATKPDGSALEPGTLYPEQQPVRLVVSAGAVPEVKGMPYDAAVAALGKANLPASRGGEVFDNSGAIAAGSVIAIEPVLGADGKPRPLLPGDTVKLTVSKGRDVVAVPNVIGMSWSRAKPLLKEAGFALDYLAAADLLSSVQVVATTPGAGKEALRGSTVTVSF